MPTDPKAGSQIAKRAEEVAALRVTSQTNKLRQDKLIADTKVAQFDLSAREIGLTTDETSLGEALQNFEKRTGMKSGLIDPATGQLFPQIRFNPNLRQMMVEKLSSTRDALSAEMQQRRDTTLRTEFESRQRHRDFNENLEEFRKREEIRAAARARKVGATTLKPEDVKAGIDAVVTEYPGLIRGGEPTAEARNLGREVTERANQLRAGNSVLTATEARQKALAKMREEGLFTGARGNGKTPSTALPIPEDKKFVVDKWYNHPTKGPHFFDGKNWLTPQEYQLKKAGISSAAALAPAGKVDDDDDGEDD